MPTYRVVVDGKPYTVEVPDLNARPVQAIVDGHVVEVSVEGTPTAAGTPRPVVDTAAPASVAAQRPAPAAPVAEPSVPAPAPAPAVTAPAGAGTGADNTVVAPLPGTIVGLSVAVGDRVEHGQELCVLEAMKMNNPIRATRSGEVKEVLVSVGQQVQYGDPLMVVAEA